MTVSVQYSHINVFCGKHENSGNPAAVIVAPLEDHFKKAEIANKLNYPVTVFISELNSTLPKLEFYYPQSKMPLCLHGALAAGKILSKLNRHEIFQFVTEESLEHSVRMVDTDHFEAKVSLQNIPFIEVGKTDICKMLNTNNESIMSSLPMAVLSVGSPKLLVPIESLEKLKSLEPNFDLIKSWSIRNKVNGIYVYTTSESPKEIFARGFNPRTGHNEDIATGTAAGALSALLEHNIIVIQGDIDSPCEILVNYNNKNDIWVGGKIKLKVKRLTLDIST